MSLLLRLCLFVTLFFMDDIRPAVSLSVRKINKDNIQGCYQTGC